MADLELNLDSELPATLTLDLGAGDGAADSGASAELPASLQLNLGRELPASLTLDLGAGDGAADSGASAELPASLQLNLGQELPANLTFDLAVAPGGGTNPDEPLEITGTISAMARPVATFTGQTGTQGTLDAATPLPTAVFTGDYNSDVFRGLVKTINHHAQAGNACRVDVAVDWQSSDPCRPEQQIVWQDCTGIGANVPIPLRDLLPLKEIRPINWTPATAISNRAGTKFALCYPLHQSRAVFWQKTSARKNRVADNFVLCWPVHRLECADWQATKRRDLSRSGRFQDATRQNQINCTGWQDTQPPPFVWPIPIEIGPPEPPRELYWGDPELNLKCLLPEPIWGGVIFNIGAADICQQALPVGWLPPGVIPRRVIILTHDLWIKLLSDNNLLPCTNIDLSIDRDTWGWSWGANLKERRPELLTAQHEVEINVDGYLWRGIIETMSGGRAHVKNGGTGYKIGGRSLAATLSTPYTAPRNRTETNARTAIQLAEAELANTGWTLDWQALDWLINAGCFSYSDLTPIGAIKKIAESIDAIIMAHPVNPTLTVRPRYAVAPWALAGATPEVTIPADILRSESVTFRSPALMRGVWVSGQSQGVRTRVYRTGSDGAPYAQMLVDPLITTTAAARERGRSVLAGTGRRRDVTLPMLLVPEIGILTPGQIAEITEPDTPWRGYIDAVSINATRATVTQTATLEHILET